MNDKIVKKEQTVGDMVNKMLPAISKALPRHLNPEAVGRIFLTEFRMNPKLLQCTAPSLMGAMMICSHLGLMPGPLGHAYLIPYKNNKTGKLECQFQAGYKGLLHLVRNSGEIKSVNANVVHEKDFFEFEFGLNERLIHRPSTDLKPGAVKYAYAYILTKDDGKYFVVLPVSELLKIKAVSKAKKSGPWFDWPEEMMKKSALKRLSKLLPLSIENQLKIAQDETTKYYDEKSTETTDILVTPDVTDYEEAKEANEKEEVKAEEKKVEETKEKANTPIEADDMVLFCQWALELMGDKETLNQFICTSSKNACKSIEEIKTKKQRIWLERLLVEFEKNQKAGSNAEAKAN